MKPFFKSFRFFVKGLGIGYGFGKAFLDMAPKSMGFSNKKNAQKKSS
jgi:hypothetical protein